MRLFFLILFIAGIYGFQRRITHEKTKCAKTKNYFYHVKADGPNDTLHYLWDFTGRPTVFLALTDLGETLNIDCEAFSLGEKNSVNFSHPTKYDFTLLLFKIIEFNDVGDTGILTPETQQILYDPIFYKWVVQDFKVNDEGKFISLTMIGSGSIVPEETVPEKLIIQLTAFGFENHDSELPRLLHSPNTTQIKITLDNFMVDPNFNRSRYALQFITVSKDNTSTHSKISTRKNLDDENSPGVFSMVDLITPKAQNQQFEGAFLQWRPVIYTSKVASIGNSSETIVYNLTIVNNSLGILYSTFPYKIHGDDLNFLLVEQTIVSLGVTEDGFYKKTNYSSWTFLVNYGSPEIEKFSLLVILVMCIGLGLPALLIITGGTYMCARRIRRNKDELSLER